MLLSNGGVTVSSGGVNISANGLTITAGTVNIANGVSILGSGMFITGGMSVRDAGLWISGGLTINSGGLQVITGGISVIANGLSITAGGLTINNLGITSAKGVVINTGGFFSNTGGATIYDTGVNIESLTVTAGGLSVGSGGMSVNLNGLVVTTGGLTVSTNGLIITGGLTVTSMTVNNGITIAYGGLKLFGADNFQVLEGGLYTAQNVTVYDSTYAQSTSGASDARFKHNIRTIDHALQKIMAIHGYSYRLIEQQSAVVAAVDETANEPASDDENEQRKQHLGVLAQEVLLVLPEAVRRMGHTEDSMLGVDYQALIPVLIEATKELAASEPFVDHNHDIIDDIDCGCDEEQLMSEVEELSQRLDSQQQRYLQLSQQLLQLKEIQRLEDMTDESELMTY